MAGVPTGTVTFLFTDVEGSTRRWEEHGDAMSAALAAHDEIVREEIAARGGHVFSTAGDSFAVAFADAAAAVDAAIAVQARLAAEDFAAVGSLPVRIGLHTGTAVERDGDYFGPDVNLAARVMSAGHGGQVLATAATAQLVHAPSLDLGEHRLRDVSEAVRLHQVLGEGLRADFPPLRTLDTTAASLPQQRSTFVGRQEEIAKVRKLLGDARLVTLTGTGGTGKTRLAVEVAAEVAPGLQGRVVFVDLSTATGVESIDAALARALDVLPDAAAPARRQLLAHVAEKVALVVVDNCEHVIDVAADLVAELLDACPSTRVVATSREQLDLDGERAFRVPPLGATPEAGESAVRLFVDRALAADTEFQVDAGGRAAVAEICERLDGIPLAIELAAARTRVLSPADILERLTDRFSLLTGGRRRVRQRQQTLEAAVAWSYDLLDEDERRAFRSLGAFTGTFDLAAAAAVLGCDEARAVDLLGSLAAKSMLERAVGRETRFRVFETLRAYAETRLHEAGEAEAARDRHLAHYVAASPTVVETIWWAPARSTTDRLLLDVDNLALAADWARARGRAADHARLVRALVPAFDQGLVGLVSARLEESLALDHDALDRATLLFAREWVAIVERDQRTGSFSAEALALVREEPEESARSVAAAAVAALAFLCGFARVMLRDDGVPDHRRLAVRAERLAQSTPPLVRAGALLFVAYSRVYEEDWIGVRRLAAEARRELGEHDLPAVLEPILVELEVYSAIVGGDLDAAVRRADAVPIGASGIAATLSAVASAVAHAMAGRLDDARRRLVASADRNADLRVSGVRGQLLVGCGAVRLAEGDVEMGLSLLRDAVWLTRSPGPTGLAVHLLRAHGQRFVPDITRDELSKLWDAEDARTAMLEDEITRARAALART